LAEVGNLLQPQWAGQLNIRFKLANTNILVIYGTDEFIAGLQCTTPYEKIRGKNETMAQFNLKIQSHIFNSRITAAT
jgi:hypothetical protein